MPTNARDTAIAALTAPGQTFELERVQIAGVSMEVFRNAPASLAEVLRRTATFGDSTFLVFEHERVSYAEHLSLAARLADHFVSLGVQRGDRVVIAARNYPEWSVAFWATIAVGAVAVPLNAWWTAPELAYAITDSGAKVLFADGERWQRLSDRIDDFHLSGVVVSRFDGPLPDGAARWSDVATDGDAAAVLPAVPVAPDDMATIMYTSGTTGHPKGAVATHRNHCTNIMNMTFMGALNAALAGPAPAAAAAPSGAPQAASLQVFPFFHIGGLSGLYLAAAFGSKLVTMYKWDIDEAVRILATERITSTSLVPMLLRQLLDSPLLEQLDRSALAGISSGGASVPPDLIQRMETQFEAKVSPANGYGLTETTSAVVLNSGSEYFRHPSSIGRPVLVAEVRVVDDDGNDCLGGDVGELWVKGPNVVQGYWNKPEATASAFVDGWFRTGDLGHRDDEGLLYVVDRLKDVVIRGGENVYSSEVEAVMFEHPAIADVAIIGIPHAVYGEEVVAVVQLRDDAQVTTAELQQFVADRLARFKVPSTIVVRQEPLPRTATGKVLKRDLRDEVAAGG